MTFCLGGCITNAFTQISSFCCFTFVWGAQLKLTTGVPFVSKVTYVHGLPAGVFSLRTILSAPANVVFKGSGSPGGG
jgi:hypothetical protein